MNKCYLLALIISFAAISDSHAYTSYGSGNHSCGSWVKWRKTESGWHQEGQWVNGFVSSYGNYGDYKLKKVDGDAILLFMDSYCQSNPLDKISDGAISLIENLKLDKHK